MTDHIHYGRRMYEATRRMIAELLAEVAEDGLPGDHYFYITFDTGHPGVDMPQQLFDRYPNEMTIVLQDWFEDLTVTSDRFAVTLNFGDVPSTLVIPFDAMKTFVDPSESFGLKFDSPDANDIQADPGATEVHRAIEKHLNPEPKDDVAETPETADDGGDVVSLDRFRKH